MSRLAGSIFVAILLAIFGCRSNTETNPSPRTSPAAAAQTGQLVALLEFDKVLKLLTDSELTSHASVVYIEQLMPEIELTVTDRKGGEHKEIFSSLLPVDAKNGKLPTGYIVIQIPKVTAANAAEFIRVRWIPTDRGTPAELALPLNSILEEEFLAQAENMTATHVEGTVGGLGDVSNFSSASYLLDSGKMVLDIDVSVKRAQPLKPLKLQAEGLAKQGVFERYLLYDLAVTKAGETKVPDDLFAVKNPIESIRFEQTKDGDTMVYHTASMSISGEGAPRFSAEPISLSEQSVDYLVTTKLNEKVVEANVITVPLNDTAIFWVKPKVSFYNDGKQRVGIALRVTDRKPTENE